MVNILQTIFLEWLYFDLKFNLRFDPKIVTDNKSILV